MRLGLMAYATNTGLGNQTKQYYDFLKPAKTMVVDLSDLQRASGKIVRSYFERYPDGMIVEGIPNAEMIESFLQDLDVVLVAETPLNYYLFERARQLGVKTVLVPNYEFNDYLQRAGLPPPDLFLLPSKWHLADTTAFVNHACQHYGWSSRVDYLPLPVDRSRLPFKPRKQARKFLHIAGHPTFMDRNGTAIVFEAMQFVKNPIELTVYTQFPIESYFDERITIKNMDKDNYWELYEEDQDVLLLPRRYGGLSLQLNEAMSVGMPVVMSYVAPQSQFLPQELLVPIKGHDVIQTRAEIKCYKPDIKYLAAKIDELYEAPEMVTALSYMMNKQADEISWQTLLPEYQKVLEQV